MSRLHDKTIRVGDIVTVTRPGQCYSTYIGWIERNVKSIREAVLYKYDESIGAGGEYRVLYMADHGRSCVDGTLCYIQECYRGKIDDCAPCYLINIKGVEKI